MARRAAQPIPYTPDGWNEAQRAFHSADTMEAAFYAASCLAGGWYGRPVRIDMQIVGTKEHYQLRPADVAPADGWRPCYTVTAHTEGA